MSFYILLARINTPIQALLRQGFGIPSGNETLKSEKHRNTREICKRHVAEVVKMYVRLLRLLRFSKPLKPQEPLANSRNIFIDFQGERS